MDPKKLTELIHGATPFIKLLEIAITAIDKDGCVEMTMPIREQFCQNLGHAHGGAIGTLADFACNLSVKQPTVTVEYKINFFAPADGEKLLARAWPIKEGRKLIISQADVFAIKGDQETQVATCLCTLIPAAKKPKE